MKKETFVELVKGISGALNEKYEHETKLEKCFGGDTVISTDWLDSYIEVMVDALEREFNDTNGTIKWLVYDCMVHGFRQERMVFILDCYEYEATPENVWHDLTNTLTIDMGTYHHEVY